MRRLRAPGVSGYLLALLLTLGLLLPEMVHSFVHQHVAEHRAPDSIAQQAASGQFQGHESHDADHPHLELIGAPSAKPSLARAAVADIAPPDAPVAGPQWPQVVAVTAEIPHAARNHGPPPPSRAPPLL